MPRRRLQALLILALAMGMALWPSAVRSAADLEHTARQRFVQALLARMSLEEKVGQLRMRHLDAQTQDAIAAAKTGQFGAMFVGPGVPRTRLRQLQEAASRHSRLGIPLFFAADVVHGHRTVFPIGLGLAASWDMQAIATSARTSAIEASADGLDMTFAPMLDITRDPRWGRISESPGEDPYLASRIASITVQALQGANPGAPGNLMACIKHFAAYGAVEGGRDYNTTDLSPQRLYQDYLPPYRAAVEAGAGALMTSLTTLNGVPATANRWLLRDILRQQWHFTGLVVSDHSAVSELITHGSAADGAAAAQAALAAGTQMSMNDHYFGEYLAALARQDEAWAALLDEAVLQVLTLKYDLGLFGDPLRKLQAPSDQRLDRARARDVARRTLVLLKNQGQLLPLARHASIALIGPLADNPADILGSWPGSGRAEQAVSLYQGMRNALGASARLQYAKGANIADDPAASRLLADDTISFDPRPPARMLAEAVALARQADVLVVALGEARGMSHEGASKADLNLAQQQRQLLGALKATGKPLVLVLMSGRPLTIAEESQMADAVVQTWYSGTEGGNAIADVLFGDYNPSGKLPVSFPRSVGQVPFHYNRLGTGRPFDPARPAKYRSRYLDVEDTPLYPFGFGLSYSDFELSAPQLSRQRLRPGQSLEVSVEVANTSQRSGETVVQLYLRDVAASISRPLKELKGFEKLMLAAGERRRVTFAIDQSMLSFHDSDLRLVSEPGWFEVMVGLDSANLQHARFELLPAAQD